MSVLVFAESWDGKFKKSTFEAVSYAFALAQKSGDSVTALVNGAVETSTIAQLGEYGAAKILHVNDPKLSAFNPNAWASMMAEAAKAENASSIVISNTYSGRALAPMLAVKLKAGLAAGAIVVPETGDKMTVRRKAFSGKAFTTVAITTPVKVISLAVNSYQVVKNQAAAAVSSFSPSIPDSELKIKSKETVKSSGTLSVNEAEIVVSGGRGMKGPEHWGILENLAQALGAATACSKPVADTGWRPHHEHVGQTGKAIAPNLYIAVGISGAIQHLAGINSSKVIVVINKDPEAPFFKAADYGIVGDVFEVLPKLTEAVKAFKAAHH